jgi:hypothetical protein
MINVINENDVVIEKIPIIVKRNNSEQVVYGLFCKDSNIKSVYVGSTNDIKQRMRNHKSNCNNSCNRYSNYKLYETIRANGGWSNWIHVIFEKYNGSKSELKIREQYWFDVIKPDLNTNHPYRCITYWEQYNKKYRIDNMAQYKDYQKQYRLKKKANV